MKYICKICGKEFRKLDNLTRFLTFAKKPVMKVFSSEDDFFVVCKDDLKLIANKIESISEEKHAFLEHKAWLRKEANRIEIAKKIYFNCKCYQKKIKNLKKLGDEVYDLMCEKCWEKLADADKILKKVKRIN